MAYRKPFTPQQRREAVTAYRSFRKHYRNLRQFYQPRSPNERRVLTRYRSAIDDMAEHLDKPDRLIDVDALTRSDTWARWLAAEYWRLRSESK